MRCCDIWVIAFGLTGAISQICFASEPVSDGQEVSALHRVILPFLETNCFHCHGQEEAKADLKLDKYPDERSLLVDRKIWDNVINMLRKHEMPPTDEPQPPADQVAVAVEAIESILANLDCGQPGSPPDAGRVTIRRLNRTEYNNTIRDLVGIDFHPADDFPADDVGYGFDNIGDVLSFSPLLAEKYLIAAESILEEALVVMDPPKRTSSRVGQLRPEFATAVVEVSGFIALEEGEYVIRARAYADQAGEVVANARIRITSQASDEVVESDVFEVPGTKDDPTSFELSFRAQKGSYRVGVVFLNPHDEIPAEAGTEQVKAEIVALIDTKRKQEQLAIYRPERNVQDEKQRQLDRDARGAARDAVEAAAKKLKEFGVKTRTLYVRSIDTDGPENPPPPVRPEVYNRLMAHAAGLDPREAAQEIVTRFASRAFRRPVRAKEIADCMSLYDAADKLNQRFELRLRAALLRVLVSPYFLYRVELDPADVELGATYAVNEYDLASRLSYFLWNSMPDDQLLTLAKNGELRADLDRQLKRMLEDSKSNSFVENFAEQWLALRKLDISSPDPKLFPSFTPELRRSMLRESLLFFGEMVREDRSILDLLSADFTYVNEPLAKLYGVPNISGNEFVRVSAPEHRGGILTQASVLTLTSNATRTSPVKRGKFVLEQILNTPPPPAPANVPPLEEDKILTGSLRQVMEQHRDNAMCASCHAKMDPLGFAFENFDAIGGWRDKDGDFAVDASGVLPDGQKFNGPDELKAIMRDQKDLFVRCVVEKMLTYALGRGLEYYDKCAVDEILVALAANDYKFSTLILEIVKSKPFQMRTAASSP